MYFEHEFAGKLATKFVPDFVLFSAFVGNDFVRPLPNFAIASGSMDLLFEIYKRMGPNFALINNGHVFVNPRVYVLLKFYIDSAQAFSHFLGGNGEI